jgi:hypothetical protein
MSEFQYGEMGGERSSYEFPSGFGIHEVNLTPPDKRAPASGR